MSEEYGNNVIWRGSKVVNRGVDIHKLSNGMTLVCEPMGDVSSSAFVFQVPAGVARDQEKLTGTATVLTELLFRGAGEMDNRRLNEQLDGLGLQRHEAVASLHCSFAGALVGEQLLSALELYAEVLRRPMLAGDQFELCRKLALQGLDSLEDDPRQRISLLAQEQFLPDPFGRPAPGKREELRELTCDEVKSQWARCFSPAGTILAIAGKFDFERVKEKVEQLFGEWAGQAPGEPGRGQCRSGFYHRHHEGAQVHISVMYPSVACGDEDYYEALAAVAVLSGGMGSRLFTEVREKRGLCYAVGASHQVIGGYGLVRCYVGSSPDRAQEALDVTLGELGKLAEGIRQEELDRAKVGLRASLVMEGESTHARALGCASDYYHLGRVRSLEEIEEAIQSLTVSEVVDHVKRFKPGNFMVTTIGPKELKVKR